MSNDIDWNFGAEISVISSLDGHDCKSSSMGYWGLIVWISMALYLMVGQFVICEEFFVPILAALGDRWKMAEDVQGATLLAVGSSSPELFTALLGVLFYPDDNPGPGTNVGSAIFNMCIIIGLSAISAPKSTKLQIVPFLRDSIAYMIGLAIMFLFYDVISPHEMELWESCILTAWWIIYAAMVYRTDMLAVRCCCCVPNKEISKTIQPELEERNAMMNNYLMMGAMEETQMQEPDFLKQMSKARMNRDETTGTMGVRYKTSDVTGINSHRASNAYVVDDNIRFIQGVPLDDDLQELLEKLNKRQQQNVNKGWVVVVMPAENFDENAQTLQGSADNLISKIPIIGSKYSKERNKGNDLKENLINAGGDGIEAIPIMESNVELSTKKSEENIITTLESESFLDAKDGNKNTLSVGHTTTHAYVRRRTLIETIEHEDKVNEHVHDDASSDDSESGHGGAQLLHKLLLPWIKLFHWTLPNPEGQFAAKHIYITIAAIILWLGILTFFVVDSAEKIGDCIGMPGDLLGITLLAIGSSLPDCISSVLVARQGKIDMAVANAFGSNIFDVNLCVGISFVLGSVIKGGDSLYLGDDNTFGELILAAAGFMVMFWLMMWWTLFRLQKWMGYFLSVAYVGYICVFTVLFIHAQDGGKSEGES